MKNTFVSLSGLSQDHHTKKLSVHSYEIRANGERDCFLTQTCEAKDAPLWWHEKGLSFTASGYGKRIPTRQMVKVNGKWRRVYCCVFSNSGTCYIGNFFAKSGTIFTVSD